MKNKVSIFKNLTPLPMPNGPKDWTEDFKHENGFYQNSCSFCKQVFFGHKRRVYCKECGISKMPYKEPFLEKIINSEHLRLAIFLLAISLFACITVASVAYFAGNEIKWKIFWLIPLGVWWCQLITFTIFKPLYEWIMEI